MNTQEIDQRNQEELTRLRNKFAGLADDVALARFDWRALMESGALASLAISRYRGAKCLVAGDLGLPQKEIDQVAEIIALGHRLLLPKDVLNAFNSVETRARQVLRSYGLQTPLGLFLPARTYDACALAMAEYQTKFGDLVAKLLADLPDHRLTMIDTYNTLARQVYDRLVNAYETPAVDRYTFYDQFVDRCMAIFPTREELEKSFSFRLVLEFVPLPYQTQSEEPSYTQASDELLRQRRAVIEDQQRARAELVNGFVAGVQSDLYTLVNVALNDVLSSLRDNGALQSRSVVQLKAVIEKISALNFWQDRTLDAIRDEITALVDKPASQRDSAINQAVLTELQDQTKIVLSRLGRVERGDLNLTSDQPAKIAFATASQPSINLTPAKPAVALSGGKATKLF